jgi:hypothetical protein
MSVSKGFSRIVALASKRPKMWGAAAAVVVAAILASVAVADPTVLFAVFSDDQGALQTKSSDPSTLNAKNDFFDPSNGTNGQACVTCHEPFLGITITVPFIQNAFATSGGTDPLFRFNDTANNPSFGSPTPANYSLFLNLGTVRIGKTVPAGADFTVVAADAFTNGTFAAPDKFPLTTNPQHPGVPSLSVFRRPLVNTPGFDGEPQRIADALLHGSTSGRSQAPAATFT